MGGYRRARLFEHFHGGFLVAARNDCITAEHWAVRHPPVAMMTDSATPAWRSAFAAERRRSCGIRPRYFRSRQPQAHFFASQRCARRRGRRTRRARPGRKGSARLCARSSPGSNSAHAPERSRQVFSWRPPAAELRHSLCHGDFPALAVLRGPDVEPNRSEIKVRLPNAQPKDFPIYSIHGALGQLECTGQN
jgi:hypothetical protein